MLFLQLGVIGRDHLMRSVFFVAKHDSIPPKREPAHPEHFYGKTAVMSQDITTGTIENLPQGSVVTFKLAGKASSPSLSQPTFQVKTTAIAPKEVEKVDSMRNLSSATWENPVARHSLQVTHQLLLENSDGTQVPLHLDAPLQFAGKLAQTTTDVIDASIVLQAGQDSATSVITTKIPQGADVTLTVQRPEAPAGYEWVASTPVEGRELFSNVQENTEKTFTWVLKKKVDTVVPPKPSDPQPEKPQSDGTAKPAQELKPQAQQPKNTLAATGFETGSVTVASFFILGMGALLLVAVKRRNA